MPGDSSGAWAAVPSKRLAWRRHELRASSSGPSKPCRSRRGRPSAARRLTSDAAGTMPGEGNRGLVGTWRTGGASASERGDGLLKAADHVPDPLFGVSRAAEADQSSIVSLGPSPHWPHGCRPLVAVNHVMADVHRRHPLQAQGAPHATAYGRRVPARRREPGVFAAQIGFFSCCAATLVRGVA